MAAQNYQRRQFEVFSSNVILDTGNPSMGYNGADVYGLYANTDAGDVSFSGLAQGGLYKLCLLYTSPSPRDKRQSRMPSSA